MITEIQEKTELKAIEDQIEQEFFEFFKANFTKEELILLLEALDRESPSEKGLLG